MPTKNNYKAIIFDFDGVIADTALFCVEEINRINRTGRFPQIPSLTGNSDLDLFYDIEILQSFKKYGFSDEETADFLKDHAHGMGARSEHVKIFQDVYKAIERCSTLKFIVTSSPKNTVEKIFKANGINNYNEIFGEIIGKETGLKKHEKLSLIRSKYKLGKSEVLYVGDMVNDIINCKKAGVDIFVVPYGYHSYDFLVKHSPTHCFKTKDEFVDFLNEFSRP